MQQVPGYQPAAVSLKRAVKSLQQIPYIHLCQSALQPLGVYTGGNTIYLMLHCPHVRSPPPHAGDSVFNFHFIFQTGRQTRQAGRRVQANGLHLAVNHHLNTRLNVIWEESTRGPSHAAAPHICFYLFWNVQLIFVVLP